MIGNQLCIATTINFNQSTYSVYEDIGSFQPVLILSVPVMFDFTIQVDYHSLTATSELVEHHCVLVQSLCIVHL